MSYIAEAFGAVEKLIALLSILCLIFIPLGMWKLIEILIWVYKHTDIIVK